MAACSGRCSSTVAPGACRSKLTTDGDTSSNHAPRPELTHPSPLAHSRFCTAAAWRSALHVFGVARPRPRQDAGKMPAPNSWRVRGRIRRRDAGRTPTLHLPRPRAKPMACSAGFQPAEDHDRRRHRQQPCVPPRGRLIRLQGVCNLSMRVSRDATGPDRMEGIE